VKFELESEDSIGKIVIGPGFKFFFAGIAEEHKLGSLRMYNFPALSTSNEISNLGEYEEFQAHHQKLNCIRLAENGMDMLTSSEDGSLIFWKLEQEQDAD